MEALMAINKNNKITSYLDWSDQGKSSLWRYVLGFLLSIVVFFVLGGLGMFPLILFVPDYQKSLTLNVLAILMAFVIPFIFIPLMVKFLHQRPYWSVAMPKLRFEMWNFFTAFWVSIVVSVVTGLLFSIIGVLPIESNPDFTLTVLLPVALIGIVGIFIQAGSEEMLFRGYFTQFARRYTSNKYVFIGVPALLFSLPHIANISQLGGGILVLIPYLISGILYGWAAYKTGSLWMALGLHLSNNYTSLVLIGTKGDVLPSAAPFQIEVPGLAVVTVLVAIQSVVIAMILNYLIERREIKV